MGSLRHPTNELLVGLFNYILYIEERNLKKRGIKLSMNDVHILESIQKASDNSMSHIAARIMVTQGTLTPTVNKLIAKGYVERYQDEKDKRIKRLRITEKALPILAIHEQVHEEKIDKAIGKLGLEENELLNETLENVLAYFREEYREQAGI